MMIILLIVVVIAIFLYFCLKYNLYLWPYNDPRSSVQKMLKLDDTPDWFREAEIVQYQPDLDYGPIVYYLLTNMSVGEYKTFIESYGLSEKFSIPNDVFVLPESIKLDSWISHTNMMTSDIGGTIDDSLVYARRFGGVGPASAPLARVEMVIYPRPTVEKIPSPVKTTYKLEDFGIKAGDIYETAKKILSDKGWYVSGTDGVTEEAGVPVGFHCGLGHTVCVGFFLKDTETPIGFYIKQDSVSKQWIVVGDVE